MNQTTTLEQKNKASLNQAIVSKHIEAFLYNDLDGVLADYTEASILITPDAICEGPDAIRKFFSGLMPHFPKGHSSFVLDKLLAEDSLVYILWHGHSPTIEVPFATDTFIVKEGKICQQTFAAAFNFID